jgi:hypothetical protein
LSLCENTIIEKKVIMLKIFGKGRKCGDCRGLNMGIGKDLEIYLNFFLVSLKFLKLRREKKKFKQTKFEFVDVKL